MKKGFTITELLAVIAIMVIILLMAVPIYQRVTLNINTTVYETKVEEVLAKSEKFAEEKGKMIFDIKNLIEEGVLGADNELQEFKDPRDGRDMSCDVVTVTYENGFFKPVIKESDICYSKEDLENMFGMITLKLEKENGSEIPPIAGTNWIKEENVFVSYQLKTEYENLKDKIEAITWSGEEMISCTKENLEECNRYKVTTTNIKTVTISITVSVNVNGINVESIVSKDILVDRQRPEVVEGSVKVENEINVNSNRRVDFEITDNQGSGVNAYSLVKEKTCKGSEFNENKKSATDGIQTVYLSDGTYYICVEDKVGNITSDEDLDNPKNQITVSKVDKGSPNITTFSIAPAKNYNSLETKLTINVTDNESSSGLKMCISNTGELKDCSWEGYTNTKDWNVDTYVNKGLDGTVRTIYLSVQDQAGNITTKTVTYQVYKECSEINKVYTEEWSSCEIACTASGNYKQTRNYDNKDKYTKKVCSKGVDERGVVRFSEGNNTKGSNGWYKTLSMQISLPSGTSSSKYCIGTSKCTPGTNLSGTNYTFQNNASSQMLCVSPKESATVSPCTCCTSAYKVDGQNPSVTSVTGNPSSWTKENVTLTINGANDAHSKLQPSAYSFDNGATWQKENKKVYSSNTNNIIIKVRDNAGNIYTHGGINITKIDKTAPTISSVTGNPSSWTKNDVTLTVNGASDTGSGLHSTAYSFDGGATWQSSNKKTYSSNKNGIVIKVRDAVGNVYTYSTINITKIDKRAPTISLYGTSTDEWTSGKVSVLVTASDKESGLHSTAYSFDNGATWQSSSSKDYYQNTNGIKIKVRDAVGNISTVSETINITNIESENPKINVDASPDGNNIVVRTGGASTSGIREYLYSLDCTNWVSSPSNIYTFTGLANGNYTVCVKAISNAGRESDVIRKTITIHTGPSIAFLEEAEDLDYYWLNSTTFVGTKDHGDWWSDDKKGYHTSSYVEAKVFQPKSSGIQKGEMQTILSGEFGSGYYNFMMKKRYSRNNQFIAVGTSTAYVRSCTNCSNGVYQHDLTASIITVDGFNIYSSYSKILKGRTTSSSYEHDRLECYGDDTCIIQWCNGGSMNCSYRWINIHISDNNITSEDWTELYSWGDVCENEYGHCLKIVERKGIQIIGGGTTEAGTYLESSDGSVEAIKLSGGSHKIFDLQKSNHYGVYYVSGSKRYISFYKVNDENKFELLETVESPVKFSQFIYSNYYTIGISKEDSNVYFYKITI